jgi:Holliday junction resolvasome RuvABC endonuclease subunit
MLILGIDLGLRADNPAAWALIDLLPNGPVVRDWAEIRPRATAWQDRVGEVGRALFRVITQHTPALIAYEAAHMEKNAQVLRKLSCVEGAILLAANVAGCPTQDVQPVQAKIALASDASATKQAMIAAARILYGITATSHGADAIGIALAGEGLYRRALIAR